MKTAVIYARFSCSKQREASIEDQIRVCTEYCQREGMEIAKTYADYAVSGRTDERPEFQAMMHAAPESDYIVVYMMDRFSRSEFDAPLYKQELLKKGVRLVSATEVIPDTAEGIIYEKLLEGLAAYESKKTAARTKRGMEGNALKGLYNGDRVFGYSVDSETHKYVVNETEAAIVREVFERRLQREPINAIAHDLAQRGIKTSTGKPAGYTFVHTMLHNDKYTGIYRWGDIAIPGGMPQIIDQQTFAKVGAVKGIKRKELETQTSYPLSGKALCGACGGKLSGTSSHGKSGKRYCYYTCKRCDGTGLIAKDGLESTIATGLRRLLDDRETASAIAAKVLEIMQGGDHAAKIADAKARIAEAEKALENIYDAIEQGIIAQGLNSRIAALESQKDAAELEIVKLEAAEGATLKDFTDFLQFGATLDDASLIDAFVWQAIVERETITVILNYNEPSGDAARMFLNNVFAQYRDGTFEQKQKDQLNAGRVRQKSMWCPKDDVNRTPVLAYLTDGVAVFLANGAIAVRFAA